MNSFLKKAGGVTTCVIAVCLINHSACAATWSGGGSESLWSDAGNWDSSPADGEALTFSGTARQINTNDLLTSVGAVDFTSTGWKVQGGGGDSRRKHVAVGHRNCRMGSGYIPGDYAVF